MQRSAAIHSSFEGVLPLNLMNRSVDMFDASLMTLKPPFEVE